MTVDALLEEIVRMRALVDEFFGEEVADALIRFKAKTGLDADVVVLPIAARNWPEIQDVAKAIRVVHFPLFSSRTTVVVFADVDTPMAAIVPPWRGAGG